MTLKYLALLRVTALAPTRKTPGDNVNTRGCLPPNIILYKCVSVRTSDFRDVYVLMQYNGYLRRTPDQPSYDFWVEQAQPVQRHFVDAEMVKAFIVSIEYKERYIP
jgi:hypothetical protein